MLILARTYDVSFTRTVIIEKWSSTQFHNFSTRMKTILNRIRSAQDSEREKYDPSIQIPSSYINNSVKKTLEGLGCICHKVGDTSLIVWPEGLII